MASKSAPAKSGESKIPPNQTLYCTNLHDKTNKQDLKRILYMLFSTYGPVIDVVATKIGKMRDAGQAFVAFKDVQASTQAMRALQGFDLLGKKMKIEYAKSKSDTIAKLDGTYKMPEKAQAKPPATDVPKSIFDAPPTEVSKAAVTSLKNTPNGLPPKPSAAPNGTNGPIDTPSPQGVKRKRDDEGDDEAVEAEEEEDDDEGAEMDVSDED
ncbi:MAG: U2 snRNP complex subunit msl1 [Bogoriella megaspora]|nr:MAG: U2 snRNP complex subunit msl1 [Bogoriella megaspora]